MSKWATFYYDVMRNTISDMQVHNSKDEAIKAFNNRCKCYFEINSSFEAKTLPARYGFAFRAYHGVSSIGFKKMFGVSLKDWVRENKERLDKDG